MKIISSILTFIVLLGLSQPLFAQQKFTISGYVKEAKSGEMLAGATILLENTEYGAYVNEYGFYSLTVPAGDYTMVVDYIGYQAQNIALKLDSDKRINVEMKDADVQGEEVLITDERMDENVKNTEMGVVEMKIEQVKKLPVLLGEVDIMKTIQLLPGVQAAEGTTGLYIRGGGPDQNLILLDEATVYNPGHLLGFFSVFNGDAVRDFVLHKGSMPARYGGRLSSVIDVSMKEGNKKSFHGKGGIGLIASRLTLEGPIIKDKLSYMISARRTYADALAQPFIKSTSQFKGSAYYFYDVNAKINYTISDKDRIFISGYLGRDVFTFKSKFTPFAFNIPWGNTTATVRWNHLFSDKLFSNTSVVYNDYNFSFGADFRGVEFGLASQVRDLNAKIDFDYYPNTRHKIKFGANYIFHNFKPNGLFFRIDTLSLDNTKKFQKFGNEAAVYVQDDWEVSDKIQVHMGLRLSGFQQIGDYTRYTYNSEGTVVDSTVYGTLQNVKMYGGIEPRAAIRYSLSRTSSLKAAFNENSQYIHMVSIAGTFPSDIWVPSSLNVRPQRGEQYSVGYFQNFKNNMFEFSVELFHRRMRNQIEYNQYYTFDIRKDYETEFVFGKGRAYGVEVFLQKSKGALTGWLGYTLARSYRIFPDLNDGKAFPFTYDRRHNVSFVLTYEAKNIHIGETILYKNPVTLSGVFVYGTGNAITPILTRYVVNNQIVNNYGPRNSFRMPDYNRADVAVTFHGNPNKKFKSNWVISVYNFYNRLNPYFIYFDTQGDPLSASLQTKAYQVSVFPVIPSITWDFEF